MRLASDHGPIYDDARRWFLERGAGAVPILVEGLEDPRLGSVAHWRILLLLRELRVSSTLPAVVKAFRKAVADGDVIVLPGAMEALAAFEEEEALSELISVLESGNADWINHAAALLGHKGGRRAEEALAALLASEHAWARRSAARGLLIVKTNFGRDLLRQHRKTEQDPGVLELLKALK
jgi:HEAT repeat protein